MIDAAAGSKVQSVERVEANSDDEKIRADGVA
jgi:hypothetical protein